MNQVTTTRTTDGRSDAVASAASATAATSTRPLPALLPPVDVVEDNTGITLYADMPGVPRDKLQLRIEGDQLEVEGEISLPLNGDLTAGHTEVARSRFRRAFTLSKELDSAKVSAELAQGVLRVRIPKAAHAQPRRIDVRVS